MDLGPHHGKQMSRCFLCKPCVALAEVGLFLHKEMVRCVSLT